MRSLILAVSCLFFIIDPSFAQEYQWRDGAIYKNVRVRLVSGRTLRRRSLMVNGSKVNLYSGTPGERETVALEDVEEIQLATKDCLGAGFLIGAGAGIVAMLIAEAIYEMPETESGSGPGYTWTTTTIHYMPLEYKILIVGAGVIGGALIGSNTKGWRSIYPTEEARKKVLLEFFLSNSQRATPGLALKFRF